ncbi:lysozyme family protein [Paracraurococcus lichenis]|uniref:Uncharacterized protein n=1 Tax=Paracraurococcus lichenis TaxID=3064888 RepID=A0ABT9EAM3_9PROT|nr:hypothetical protein [Paracraurococcus sp. LOR1-02]MDO9713187.1 hypothetical protein [Paracraurococcus sp. LOR1-02]
MTAAALALVAFHTLAAACVPGIAPETLAAIVRAESGLRVLAIAVSAGASTTAAFIGGTVTDSNHSQRTYRRGAYGSYGQPGYGSPTFGRGFTS